MLTNQVKKKRQLFNTFVTVFSRHQVNWQFHSVPGDNLDIAASRSLMRVLRDLAASHGRTIVIVLHDINYAAAYADLIVAMKGGRIVATGTPDDIVTEAVLREVFETDPKIHRIDGKVIIEV